MKKRMIYAIYFIAILIVEILIGMYVRDRLVRPYVGDMLVVALIYYFIRIFIPKGVKALPFYVFAFACFIEVLQYFQLVEILGLTNQVAKIVLGSTFDFKDLICYAVGCFFILVVEHFHNICNRLRSPRDQTCGS